MKWILVLLKLVSAQRREVSDGEFVLDEDEVANVYTDGGVLMWRGRKLLQAGTQEVNKVQQAMFDQSTQVGFGVCMHLCLHTYTHVFMMNKVQQAMFDQNTQVSACKHQQAMYYQTNGAGFGVWMY